ncbi:MULTISPECIES: hypothetical protein [unclassified Neorhizobium]|uniref:hypothetical protein n=1 Tax=unclassified Neorhizobium TaxID=2629175 RepID=UPI001FF51FEC|nr:MULTISPECIES: hypothetical protein [unclassified Neorhizobium]MCJ9673043.1 hypothetical protein [Neorhizobium sp. SHOUNA12B]MCJ9748553.1 hypothetical protein [Neorhizobium sp. SHOUNA12A]
MVQRKKWLRVTGNDDTVRIPVPMEELPSRDKSEDKPEEKLVPELLLKALEVGVKIRIRPQVAITEKSADDVSVAVPVWRNYECDRDFTAS